MASTTTTEPAKRKNEEPRRRPQWWMLVVGIVIGALLIFIIVQGRSTPTATSQDIAIPEGIELTATAIINGATATARAAGVGS